MANLSFTGTCPVVNAAIHNQAAANTAAQSDVKNRVKLLAGASLCFAQGSHIGVIVDADRHAGQLVEPATQIEFRPPLDLMRTADPARRPINRTAKPNSNPAHLPLGP